MMMSDDFGRLIAREGGGGPRRRRSGPPTRPPFTAHVALDWDEDQVKEHLLACQTGRDQTGEWKIDLEEPEAWAWMHETTPGPWSPLLFREVEVP
jgi:hypothetical protein